MKKKTNSIQLKTKCIEAKIKCTVDNQN